jgi:hypothetical protein
MELNQIIKQLEKEFAINKDDRNEKIIINVYPKNRDGSVNLDVGIKLENLKNSQMWSLNEVQRDKEYELGQFSKRELGFLALYIAIKGKFEKVKGNELVKNELREIEKDLIKGDTILQNNINNKYYSLDQEKEGAINLYKEDQKYNIYYLTYQGEKIIISRGRPLSSTLVVIYNYSMVLEKFDDLIKPWINELSISLNEEEKLKRIYFGK